MRSSGYVCCVGALVYATPSRALANCTFRTPFGEIPEMAARLAIKPDLGYFISWRRFRPHLVCTVKRDSLRDEALRVAPGYPELEIGER